VPAGNAVARLNGGIQRGRNPLPVIAPLLGNIAMDEAKPRDPGLRLTCLRCRRLLSYRRWRSLSRRRGWRYLLLGWVRLLLLRIRLLGVRLLLRIGLLRLIARILLGVLLVLRPYGSNRAQRDY